MYPQTQHPAFKTHTSLTKPPLGPSSCVIVSLTSFKMYKYHHYLQIRIKAWDLCVGLNENGSHRLKCLNT